jgi:hypothetical protein
LSPSVLSLLLLLIKQRENREVIKKIIFAECCLQWLSAKRQDGAALDALFAECS